MPALAKVATATALALSLAGGATAIAQSTTGVQSHTTYVTLIAQGPDEPARPVIQGTVGCDAPLHQRLLRTYIGRPACKHAGYAYAWPEGMPAPWQGEIRSVNDSQHVTEDGELYHLAEITYRAVSEAPEGGPELVHALASELHPIDRSDADTGARYALPLDPDVIERDAANLSIEIGPAPPAGADPAPV